MPCKASILRESRRDPAFFVTGLSDYCLIFERFIRRLSLRIVTNFFCLFSELVEYKWSSIQRAFYIQMMQVDIEQVSFPVKHRAFSILAERLFKVYEVNISKGPGRFHGNSVPEVSYFPVYKHGVTYFACSSRARIQKRWNCNRALNNGCFAL